VLRIGGKRIVDMGNYCNTCALLFEHMANPRQRVSVTELADHLKRGVRRYEFYGVLPKVIPVLPRGGYEIALLEMQPRLVQRGSADDYFVAEQAPLWGFNMGGESSHDPGVDYYRATTLTLAPDTALFEFIVPLYDTKRLNPDTVTDYERSIQRGAKPTAMSISLLDMREPAMWPADPPTITRHYVLSHYLIDGHHKVFAAAQTGKPMTLLSFLARDHCMASVDDVVKVLAAMDAA
jgi:hypothetical protein